MQDNNKTKAQLVQELAELRARVRLLENGGKGDNTAAGDIAGPEQTGSALNRSEARSRAMLAAMPDLIFTVKNDGTVLDVSGGQDTDLYNTASRIVGHKVKDILPPDLAEDRMYYIHQALETGEPQRFEFEIIIDGRKHYEEGRIIVSGEDEVLNIVRDITERKEAEIELARRAAELETVARVSIAISTILDVETLLQEVADLTKAQFILYHAHIYLLNEAGDILDLVAGAGEVGRKMVAQGWQIPCDREQSLVARAARSRQGVIVNHVRQSPDWRPNPLLPDTHSELAVPMLAGETLIGVLDVHASRVDYFTEEDIRVHSTLAAQIAVALQNARLYGQTQSALQKSEILYQGSDRIVRARSMADVLLALVESTPLQQLDRANVLFFDQPWTTTQPEIMTVVAVWERSGEPPRAPIGTQYQLTDLPVVNYLRKESPAVFADIPNDERTDQNFYQLMVEGMGMRSIVAFPMVAGGQWVGLLTGQAAMPLTITAEDIRQISGFTDQAAAVMQSQRLLVQMQESLLQQETTAFLLGERVKELDCLNDIGRKLTESPPVPEFLQWVTDRIPPAMQYPAQCRAAIEYREQIYGAQEAIELTPKMVQALRISGSVVGRVHIAYTDELEFLDEESSLLGGIANRVSSYIQSNQLGQQTNQLLAEVQRLAAIVENAADFIGVISMTGDTVYVNPAGLQLLGLPKNTRPESIDLAKYIPSAEAQTFIQEGVPTALQWGSWQSEGKVIRINRQEVDVAKTLTPIYNENREPVALSITMRDITAQKQAARERERLLAELSQATVIVENTTDFVAIFNLEGQPLYVNPAGRGMVGWEDIDIRKVQITDAHPPETAAYLEEQIFPLVMAAGSWAGELELQHVDGTVIAVSQLVVLIRDETGAPTAFATNARNISDRRAAELEREQLLAQVQRLAAIVEHHPDFIGVSTLEGQAQYVNPAGLRMMGLSPDYDVTTMQALDFYPQPDAEKLMNDGVLAALEQGSWTSEARLMRVDGSTVPVEQTVGINYNAKGQPLGFSITMRDITERQRADAERERLLVEVEAAYRQYVAREWEQYLQDRHQGRWHIEHREIEQPAIPTNVVEDDLPTVEVPIELRGQQIGRMRLEDVAMNRHWTAEELALIQTVTEQVALTVENLRLFEQTQQRASREQLTREITDKMRAAPDVESIVETGLKELANVLGVSRTYVKLAPDLSSASSEHRDAQALGHTEQN
jgi:PAS domain S-box-containing protein